MAILFKDRVKDTTTTTGTGSLTITNSAPSGFVTFNSAFGTGSTNKFYYCIDGGAEWETGIGYLSSSTVLVRDTFLASSSGSAVSFSAGTKTVFATVVASYFPPNLARIVTTTLQMNVGTKQNVLTAVPTGKRRVIQSIFVRDPSYDISGSGPYPFRVYVGYNAGADNFIDDSDVSNLTGSNQWDLIKQAGGGAWAMGAAGDVLGVLFPDAIGTSETIKVDVAYFDIDA